MEIPESASRGYTLISKRMLSDMRDNNVAVGVYALVGRLWRISHQPVPLSAQDIALFDPSITYGAARRALSSLTGRGWLLADATQRKMQYTPTWGRSRRGDAPQPWDETAKGFGCPRSTVCVRLDDALLDVYIGRLEPHELHTAEVERYWSEPYIGLRDVAVYVKGLQGTATSDPPLEALGLMRNGQSVPLPARTSDVLALLSQRALWTENAPTPSKAGLVRFGLMRDTAPAPADTSQPLFFVAHTDAHLIGQSLPEAIPYARALTDSDERTDTAPERAKPTARPASQSAAGIIRDLRDSERSTHHPPTGGGGGRSAASATQEGERRTRSTKQTRSEQTSTDHESPVPLRDTESTRLLHALHVSPRVVARFADLDPAQVRAAIADAESREEVRDRAAWAVSLLKQHQSTGWNLVAAQDARQQARSGPWTAADVERWSDTTPATLHAEPAPRQAIAAPEVPARTADPPRASRQATVASETPLQDANPPQPRAAPMVFVPRPVVVNPPSSDDIATGIRGALRAALPRDTWPVVDTLAITADDGIWTLCFARTSERLRYGVQMLAIARAELAERHLPDTVRVVDRPAAPPPPTAPPDTSDEGRPDWIAADAWRSFSPMVRAALRGAEMRDGAVVARNAAAQRVLERFGPALTGGAPC